MEKFKIQNDLKVIHKLTEFHAVYYKGFLNKFKDISYKHSKLIKDIECTHILIPGF